MKPQAVYEALQNNPQAYFIDVRQRFEYAAGHAVRAQLMPLPYFKELFIKANIPKDATVYMICHSGGRSAVATAVAKRLGYEHVHNVEGGTAEWKRAHLPIEQSPHKS